VSGRQTVQSLGYLDRRCGTSCSDLQLIVPSCQHPKHDHHLIYTLPSTPCPSDPYTYAYARRFYVLEIYHNRPHRPRCDLNLHTPAYAALDMVMNLSSLVHTSRVRQEQARNNFTTSYIPSRHTQVAMASAMVGMPYTAHVSHPYSYISTPQAPPSPPIEEAPKCSLPSISSLLGLADSPTTQEQSQRM